MDTASFYRFGKKEVKVTDISKHGAATTKLITPADYCSTPSPKYDIALEAYVNKGPRCTKRRNDAVVHEDSPTLTKDARPTNT